MKTKKNYRSVKSDTNIVRSSQRVEEENEIISRFGHEDFIKDGHINKNVLPTTNEEVMNKINDNRINIIKKHKKQISFGIKEFQDMSSR